MGGLFSPHKKYKGDNIMDKHITINITGFEFEDIISHIDHIMKSMIDIVGHINIDLLIDGEVEAQSCSSLSSMFQTLE